MAKPKSMRVWVKEDYRAMPAEQCSLTWTAMAVEGAGQASGS